MDNIYLLLNLKRIFIDNKNKSFSKIYRAVSGEDRKPEKE